MIGRSEIIDTALAALRQYGESGDSSFECIGLLADGSSVRGIKTYRLYQKASFLKAVELGEAESALCERKQGFLSHPHVKIFDLSEFEGSDGERAKRIVFSVRRDVPSAESYEAVRMFFDGGEHRCTDAVMNIAKLTEETLSPGKSPVVQIGAEYDRSGREREIKVYYSLNRCRDFRDLYGVPSAYGELSEYLRETVGLLGFDGSVTESFDREARMIERFGYHPTIIGLNFKESCTEFKLYYLFAGNREDYKRVCAEGYPFSRLGDDYSGVGDELFDGGLFLKGIAQSCVLHGGKSSGTDDLRLYYFRVPRQLKNS